MKTVEKETVEEWVRAIGSTPNELNDEATEWRFEFDYPAKTGQRMSALQPKGAGHQLLIVTGLSVSHDHLKAHGDLPEDEQKEFGLGLRRVLTRPEVDFRLAEAPGPLDCPKNIQISRTRYGDGLTLDAFAESVGHVHKAKLHAIFYFEDRLGEHRFGIGGAGRFDFRRL